MGEVGGKTLGHSSCTYIYLDMVAAIHVPAQQTVGNNLLSFLLWILTPAAVLIRLQDWQDG